MAMMPSPDVGVDYASELFIVGDTRGAAMVCDRLLGANQNDLNSWLLRAVIARSMGDKDALAKALKSGNVAASNQLAVLRHAAGDAAATTRPVDVPDDVPLPDPDETLAMLARTHQPELLAAYAPVANGIVWMKLYFGEGALVAGQSMNWIKSIADLGGDANSAAAERLTGWAMLVAGNKDDAQETPAAGRHRCACGPRADPTRRQYPQGPRGGRRPGARRSQKIRPGLLAQSSARRSRHAVFASSPVPIPPRSTRSWRPIPRIGCTSSISPIAFICSASSRSKVALRSRSAIH